MPQITSSEAANGLPIHKAALPGTRAATLPVALDARARTDRPPRNEGALPGRRAATILVAFDAGARTERPDENGMAHFLEHLVFKGGVDFPAAPPGTGAPRR